ncbi:MAG TPA: glycosyltransferase [Firmicutes bacterium]|nr:glycosyltransferase [Bacillota bacterium]
MKVLLQNRSSYRNSVAGDGVQMVKTQEYLKKLQVDADISSSPDTDLSQYDLVHLFNLMPVDEMFPLFLNARKQKKKIVLSTIYWNPDEFLKQSEDFESLKLWWQKSMPLRDEVLRGVDLILPNSELELAVIKKQFLGVPRARVVINGVDQAFYSAKPQSFMARHHCQDFLLSVGRICRRKNQLAIIRAAAALDLPLVIIGPLNDGLYYRECRRAAAGHHVLFIDRLSQQDLCSAYAAARIHVLVSWYDTPGLVSLEAALAGCAVVTTIRGSAKEYFGNLAYYCNPANEATICSAIKAAWKASNNLQLKTHIFTHFTWEKAAKETLEAYRSVLG